jgi:hypothetical protein
MACYFFYRRVTFKPHVDRNADRSEELLERHGFNITAK